MGDTETNPTPEAARRYAWPWWVLGAVVLAVLLAVLWMSREIARTRRIRDLNAPPPTTNQGAPAMPAP
jgi:hypothetical protein